MKKLGENLIAVFIVIFTLFIIIQIIKVMFSGSWAIEDVIVGLLIANLSWSFLISYTVLMHLGGHKGYRKGISDMKIYLERIERKINQIS